MVPGTRLLLTLAAGLLLAGCPAEMMGVELPRGGPEAVSQEDLRRDAWLVQQAAEGGGEAGAGEALARRLGEMRVLPAFGRAWVRPVDGALQVCGRKEGDEAAPVLIIAQGQPTTAGGAASQAALVSLAKGYDQPRPPARTVIFCATSSDAATTALLHSPPVPAADLHAVMLLRDLVGGAPQQGGTSEAAQALGLLPPGGLAVLSGEDPVPNALGEIDYRRQEQLVRRLLEAIPVGE